MTFAGRFFLRCSSYLMLKLRRSGRLVGGYRGLSDLS